MSQEEPNKDGDKIEETEDVEDKKPEDVIVVAKSKGRRGSTTFLTSDDNIVLAFGSGRRLSSFCTTSSYEDTAISMNDEYTEEEISETIRAHKQIIANMKQQTWPMYRKLKVLNRAKHYINKHEGELKQSKKATDLVAKWNVYIERSINRIKRELANMIVFITPWEMRIKKIESHFGSGVASYFIFLRWVFWVNLFISVFICCFLMVPEILRNDNDKTGMRKEVKDKDESLSLQAIWDFEGYLKYSPIFYGYYSKAEMTSVGYRLPLAYFLTAFCLYMFSFFCVLQKMAQNARMSRIATKDDESTFCWKIFTGWDYMIGNSETAYNKVASLVMSLKEAILEEKERKKEERDWKRIALRVLANIMVLMLLASSAYGVVLVVERSQEDIKNPSWLRANEVTLVVAGISIVFPNIFDWIGSIEAYHPRIALRWQLARILILNFLNMYTLMLSLFSKIDTMTLELSMIKGDIALTRNQMDTIIVSTLANFKVKREGRVLDPEYEDYEENDDSTLQPPSIIDDPYYKVHQKYSPIEGRHHFKDQSMEETTTLASWMIVPTTSVVGMNQTENYNLSNKLTTIPGPVNPVNTMSNEGTTSPSNQQPENTAAPSTRRPKSRRPTTRMKLGDITTTTELVTESNFPITTQTNFCMNVTEYRITEEDLISLNETVKDKLRTLCWETMFGQELVKLTIMDLVLTVISTIISDFIRALIVRYCNGCTCICWDLEKGFPGYGDFKIAENILHLVNNQGMIWLGMFFSPGLPAINTFKLCILMYVRSWAVLTSNIPHETVFKASRNNNFYYMLLLLMLFLCTLPVSYAVVWLEPSWHCGPFSDYSRIYKILSEYVQSKLPDTLNKVLDFITSPGAVLPFLLLLVLFIYYLLTTVGSLKEANKELKSQIRKDKDTSETGNVFMPPEIVTEQSHQKHVRISDEKNEKTNLLESCDNSVVSS